MVQTHNPYVLGIGSPFLDRFALVDDKFLIKHNLIKGDTALTEDAIELTKLWEAAPKHADHQQGKLGGSCCNVIKVLAKHGYSTALCGKVGNDSIGRRLQERIETLGITSRLIQGRNGTGIVNCFVTPDTQRTMQAYLGAAAELTEADLTKEIFCEITHVHIEGYVAYYGHCFERSIALAKEHGARVSIDLASPTIINLFKERIVSSIADVDYIFGNKNEILELCSFENIQTALRTFPLQQTVIATEGAKGCWIKEAGQKDPQHYDAFKVEYVIDTTGAGDYFDGGFLHGIFQGKTISDCVRLGNTEASSVIQKLGADD